MRLLRKLVLTSEECQGSCWEQCCWSKGPNSSDSTHPVREVRQVTLRERIQELGKVQGISQTEDIFRPWDFSRSLHLITRRKASYVMNLGSRITAGSLAPRLTTSGRNSGNPWNRLAKSAVTPILRKDRTDSCCLSCPFWGS